MSVTTKIVKFFHDPAGVVRHRLHSIAERLRFRRGADYNAAGYWRERHSAFGFDLRGVGDKTKSHEENVLLLEEGRRVFLDICRQANVQFPAARALDIGCGTGHFAQVLLDQGVTDYLGIDIVDTLFAGLHKKLPGYRFQQLDVSTQPLDGSYDLILAMDVLQHITDDIKFLYALENMRSHLAPGGTIIISINIGENERPMFYMVKRPLETFRKAFPDFMLSEPTRYAESHVFSLRHKHTGKT